MVRNPVISQAPINKAGELTSRAISAETKTIPEPIIDPITSMVELVRPRPLTNSRSVDGLAEVACAGLVSTVSWFSEEVQELLSLPVIGRLNGGTRHWSLATALDFTPECAKIP